ncbi:MAG: PLP-dependent aminotransferase family protein [Blastocatellia bacterium]|nr:PLP-dependent aminotransferase family protein [Blastocatellia bacterium]
MLIRIDRESVIPVYEQIKEHIRGLIEAGQLKPGARLPSSRNLADTLGVNRTTVCTAYEELEADGYLASHVGQGTYVTAPDQLVGKTSERRVAQNFTPKFSRRSDFLSTFAQRSETLTGSSRADRILFSGLTPEEDLFPVETFRTVLNSVMRERGRELLQYGNPQGYLPLREYISSRLVRYSISAPAEQIAIVTGSQQGIDLIMRTLTDPHDRVIIESPSYGELLPVLAQYEVDVIPIPVGSRGMDLDILEQKLNEQPARLIYSMPNFHNPTGATMELADRKRLVDIVAQHKIPLVEDDYEKDLRFEGTPIVPVKALDTTGTIIYMGTFSKGLFPGVRVAWVAASREIIDRIVLAKRYSDFHTNLLMQAAITEFCVQGHYDAHLRRLHKIYQLRRRRLLDALKREFPDSVSWTKPDGGYALWVTMPPQVDAEDLLLLAKEHGIFFTPGRKFYMEKDCGKSSFRLCYSRTDAEQIDEGIAILGSLIKKLLKQTIS